jgi:hypothetical protein
LGTTRRCPGRRRIEALDVDAILDALVRELSLPDGVVSEVARFLNGISATLRQPAEVDVVPHVLAQACLAAGVGTAVPPTVVTVEPATLTFGGVEVTLSTGTPVPRPFRPWPLPLKTRQDLFIGAILVLCVALVYISFTPGPLTKALIAPLNVAIGLLTWLYPRL